METSEQYGLQFRSKSYQEWLGPYSLYPTAEEARVIGENMTRQPYAQPGEEWRVVSITVNEEDILYASDGTGVVK